MNLNISKSEKEDLKTDEINVIIEHSIGNKEIEDFERYLKQYKKENDTVIVSENNSLISIKFDEIICFFSDKKHNYCRTKSKTYMIKNKLYEIEKMNIEYIRISKSTIINIQKVKEFDLGQTGRIVVKFIDGTEEYVSRRKIKDIMIYLDERRI